jgi:hypothetical protein
MCRNIKTLYNFEPPATEAEIRDAALQYVRKVSGIRNPSAINARIFTQTVDRITADITTLLQTLQTTAVPKNREVESMKLRLKTQKRFGSKMT